jgi:hypothetical protein
LQVDRQIRLSEDKRKLQYKVNLKGPDGEEVEREMEFEIPNALPPNTEPERRRRK